MHIEDFEQFLHKMYLFSLQTNHQTFASARHVWRFTVQGDLCVRAVPAVGHRLHVHHGRCVVSRLFYPNACNSQHCELRVVCAGNSSSSNGTRRNVYHRHQRLWFVQGPDSTREWPSLRHLQREPTRSAPVAVPAHANVRSVHTRVAYAANKECRSVSVLSYTRVQSDDSVCINVQLSPNNFEIL